MRLITIHDQLDPPPKVDWIECACVLFCAGINVICYMQADMGGVKDQGAWSMNDWEDKLIDNLLNFAGTPKVSNFFLLFKFFSGSVIALPVWIDGTMRPINAL